MYSDTDNFKQRLERPHRSGLRSALLILWLSTKLQRIELFYVCGPLAGEDNAIA